MAVRFIVGGNGENHSHVTSHLHKDVINYN